MRVGEINTEQGFLSYEITGESAKITGYRGRDLEITLPEQAEGFPVMEIGKKAFLGNKTIRQITLPDTVERIGDWAFAHCAGLQRMILPYRYMEIGQGIFKDCLRLEQIVDKQADIEEKKTADTAYLLAAAMSRLDAFYLFDFETVGTGDWIARWDSILIKRMEVDDADGFSKMLLCGEEDYGSKDNNKDYYMEQQRRGKVRLAMLRLMHDFGLSEAVRARLTDYITSHAKGQESEEAWLVVLEEHGDEKEYYQFLIDCGCVTPENYQGMLDDMGGQHTEMKAFLMRHHAGQSGTEDAFAAFEL